MDENFVLILDNDVILYERCGSRRRAYREAIGFIIKDRRGALPDRGPVHPKPAFVEVREAVQYFNECCELRPVTLWL